MFWRKFKESLYLALIFLGVGLPLADGSEVSAFTWPEIETTQRPGAYWWWPGSAVDEANITANLEAMREAGMGGGTIVSIYGANGYEERYIEFLSPKWLEMASHAAEEAERLGMWVDMTPGTGWPFGGPMVTSKHRDSRAVFKGGEVSLEFSGRRVKRAAPGGEGYALNPFSPEAMAAYLRRFDRAFRRVDGLVLPRAFYHDSFEYKGNWSPGLLEAFEALRGYDLEPYLPLLFGEERSERIARIKADYRETLSDLHMEYIKLWVDWANEWGSATRNQAHGATANLLDLYAAADIPETETFGATKFQIPGVRYNPAHVSDMGPPQPMINRFASSAAHVASKPLVAAETATWLRNHFRSSLSQAKPEIDQLFLNGINHVFFHGTCFSPEDALWPGWLFYASFQYNPRNSIWRDASALNRYIARCQSILQAGEPDNDIALYWPAQDVWHDPQGLEQMLTVHHAEWLMESECADVARWLEEKGYAYDFISDRQLASNLRGVYRAVVVPKTEHMPVATALALERLEDSGIAVLFVDDMPKSVPGHHRWEQREAVLKELLDSRDWASTKLGDLKADLERAGVKREPMVRKGLEFVRRSHDAGYYYFIANMGSQPVDRWIQLGTPFASAVLMDPQSSKTGLAPSRENGDVYLQLQPGETRVLRTFASRRVEGPAWSVWEPLGAARIQLKGEWEVDFIEGAPVLPESFSTKILGSWTQAPDSEAERFAGAARYSLKFELPERPEADGWMLDLGEVRESARVAVNGNEVAILYSVPFAVEVGKYLMPGTNTLEIEVTNLAANRIRDLDIRGVDWKIFHDINFVDHLYNEFDASHWELVPSGLLGPVSLQPMRRREL